METELLRKVPLEWLPVVIITALFIAFSLMGRLNCKANGNNNDKMLTLLLDRVNHLENLLNSELGELKKEIMFLREQFGRLNGFIGGLCQKHPKDSNN